MEELLHGLHRPVHLGFSLEELLASRHHLLGRDLELTVVNVLGLLDQVRQLFVVRLQDYDTVFEGLALEDGLSERVEVR